MSTSPVPMPSPAELAELYRPPQQQWVRASMVSTLDGHAVGADGRSGSINSEADQMVFHAIRDIADVVVIGAATARIEGYRRLRGGAALAVLTCSGLLPERLLEVPEASDSGDRGPLVVLCPASTPQQQVDAWGERVDAVIRVGDTEVDPHQGVAALWAGGWNQIVCEGGPTVLAQWLAAGVVDELALTLRPTLLGAGSTRIVDADWTTAVNAHLSAAVPMGSDLMLRYRFG